MTYAAPRISSRNSSLGISQMLEDDQPKKMRRSTTLPPETFKEPNANDTCLGWSGFIISLYFNKIAVNVFGGLTGWKWYNRYLIFDRICIDKLT
jgi:atypical dual specificity phosphatase